MRNLTEKKDAPHGEAQAAKPFSLEALLKSVELFV